MELALSYPPGDNLPKRRPVPRVVLTEVPASMSAKIREPGWANGLRELYNSVLHEPLPGTFDDLLKQLDKDDDA